MRWCLWTSPEDARRRQQSGKREDHRPRFSHRRRDLVDRAKVWCGCHELCLFWKKVRVWIREIAELQQGSRRHARRVRQRLVGTPSRGSRCNTVEGMRKPEGMAKLVPEAPNPAADGSWFLTNQTSEIRGRDDRDPGDGCPAVLPRSWIGIDIDGPARQRVVEHNTQCCRLIQHVEKEIEDGSRKRMRRR